MEISKMICVLVFLIVNLNLAQTARLQEYFKSIKLKNGTIEFTFKNEGLRFFIQAADGPKRLSEYNQTIICSPDTIYTFISRDINFQIIPFEILKKEKKDKVTKLIKDPNNSFYFEERADFRSLRGGKQIKKEIVFKNNEKNRDKNRQIIINRDSTLIVLPLDSLF